MTTSDWERVLRQLLGPPCINVIGSLWWQKSDNNIIVRLYRGRNYRNDTLERYDWCDKKRYARVRVGPDLDPVYTVTELKAYLLKQKLKG